MSFFFWAGAVEPVGWAGGTGAGVGAGAGAGAGLGGSSFGFAGATGDDADAGAGSAFLGAGLSGSVFLTDFVLATPTFFFFSF